MFTKKTIKNIPIKGQTILLRTDYNVPEDDFGAITDDLRIRASLPTINYLLENKAAKIIIISHLGRPEGKRDKIYTLAPVAARLAELLPKTPVHFVSENCGPEVEEAVEKLPKGGILLLENLRFSPDEEKNSEDFASEIIDSVHPDLFVQDGFAVIHRAHTSTEAITRLLPSAAGLLLEKEVSTLSSAIENPARPLLLIIGGSKVEDKQPLIDKFKNLADTIFVGGKIAADGYTSPNKNIIVASDFVSDSTGAKLDIGEKSTQTLLDLIKSAKTIVWNGLLGKAEDPPYAKSSLAAAKALGQTTTAATIIGGTSTSGGHGSVWKTYIAVLGLMAMFNVLTALVGKYEIQILSNGVVLASVVLYETISNYIARKKIGIRAQLAREREAMLKAGSQRIPAS